MRSGRVKQIPSYSRKSKGNFFYSTAKITYKTELHKKMAAQLFF